jgi:hypothetical protein
MFTNKTVFILGAGASWHYGYPTGEELVKQVIKRCELAENSSTARCKTSINIELNIFNRRRQTMSFT